MRYQETYSAVDDTEDWEAVTDTSPGRFGERDQTREYRPETQSPAAAADRQGIAARIRALFRTSR